MATKTPKGEAALDTPVDVIESGTGLPLESASLSLPESDQADKLPTLKKDTQEPTIRGEEKSGFCVYLGPSISGVIINGTVYATDRKATLAEIGGILDKYPLIASLIVPGDTLPESRIKVKNPGNLLYMNYNKLVGKLK